MSDARASLAAISAIAHAKAEFGEGRENGLIYVAIVLDVKTSEISSECHGDADTITDLVTQVAARMVDRGLGRIVERGPQ